VTTFPPPPVAIAPLPDRWTQLRFHAVQSRLWRSGERDVKVCAGRGSGKTELARRKIVRSLRIKKDWDDPRYFYALPTYGQCKRVAREHILSLIPKGWLTKVPGDSTMEFKTVFGSWLFLVGLDMPARVEGDQYDGGVVDESSDQKPGVYARTLRPALTHRDGWLWRIGVPKRFGVGATEFRVAFDKGLADGSSFHWPSWDILSAEEIAALRRELDDKDFNEQIGGKWEDAGGAAYYAFGVENVDETIAYDPERTVYCFMDFNVDPMAWVLAHRVTPPGATREEVHVFDEVWLRNTNTQATLNTLYNRYGAQHKGGWVFGGDASSKNRHTSASRSDYVQIRSDARFKARIVIDDSNPAVRDRLAAVNLACKNAAGEHRLKLHPRAAHTIADLRTRSLDPYGNPMPAEPGQAHDSGHATDALGYMIYKYYPVRAEQAGTRLMVVS
jgi:hypothetical protein